MVIPFMLIRGYINENNGGAIDIKESNLSANINMTKKKNENICRGVNLISTWMDQSKDSSLLVHHGPYFRLVHNKSMKN